MKKPMRLWAFRISDGRMWRVDQYGDWDDSGDLQIAEIITVEDEEYWTKQAADWDAEIVEFIEVVKKQRTKRK